jgi:protein-tyrosine phosphatase
VDFSNIIDTLYIGTTPRTEYYPTLLDLSVCLVINMRIERPPYRNHHDPNLRTLWFPTIDSPLVPIPISMLKRGAKAAMETIQQGEKVYTHCAAGKHRGVAMGASILIALGYSVESATQLIIERRPVADPNVWYIRRRIIRFAELWNHNPGGGKT